MTDGKCLLCGAPLKAGEAHDCATIAARARSELRRAAADMRAMDERAEAAATGEQTARAS